MNKNRTAIYVRVSDEAEEDFERYVIDCEDFADDNELSVTHILEDSISGTKPINERPKGQELLELVHSGSIDAVLLPMFDRWTRHDRGYHDIDILWDAMVDAGTTLYFEDLGELPLTVENHAQLVHLAEISASHRREILRKFLKGKRIKLRGRKARGEHKPAKPPETLLTGMNLYGYTREHKGIYGSKTNPHRSWALIDPITSLVVKDIFKMHANGMTCTAIAEDLNERGIPAPMGGKWKANVTMFRLLNNRAYLGEWQWGKTKQDNGKQISRSEGEGFYTFEYPELAIIDLETWERSQAVSKQKSNRVRHKSKPYLLTGFMFCECGLKYTGTSKARTLKDGTVKRTRYYMCSSAKKGKGKACGNGLIRADDIEDTIWEQVLQALEDEDKIKATLQANLNGKFERRDETQSKIDDLENQIKQVSRNLDLTIDLTTKVTGNAGIDRLADKINKLSSGIDLLETERSKLQSQVSVNEIDEDLLLEKLQEYRTLAVNADFASKQYILGALGAEVVKPKDGDIQAYIFFSDSVPNHQSY